MMKRKVKFAAMDSIAIEPDYRTLKKDYLTIVIYISGTAGEVW